MKKTISIALSLLIIISILPFAYAENIEIESDTRVLTDSETNTELGDSVEVSTDDNERGSREENKGRKRAETKIKSNIEIKNLMKERIESRKNLLHESRKDFLDLKKDLKSCRGKDNDKCDQLRIDVQLKSKEYMLGAAMRIIETLELAKEKLEETNINAEVKTGLLSRLETDIKAMNDVKIKIQGINESEPSKEQVKDVAEDLKSEWKRSQRTLLVINYVLVDLKANNILEKSEKLKERLNKIIESLESKGELTAEIKLKVDELNIHLNKAKEKREEALKIFAEVPVVHDTEDQEVWKNTKEGHKLHKEAREELRKAHKLLIEIVRLIKGTDNLTVIAESNTEVNVEE